MNKDHTTKRYVFVTLLNVVITIAEFIGGIFFRFISTAFRCSS